MLKRQEVIERLNTIAMASGISSIIGVDEDSKLQEDLGMKSINILFIAVAIEEEFNIRFENTDLMKFITLRDIVDFIINKKAGN